MATRRRRGQKRGTSGRSFDKRSYVDKGNSRYDRHDPLFRRAREEGYVARSIYKLEELDRSFKLVRPGDLVLDLGCAPGSWLQYTERVVREKGGRIVGIDRLPVKLAFGSHVHIIQGDIYDQSLEDLQHPELGADTRFDLVLSDMAPDTTGIRTVDQARSADLTERALEFAIEMLRDGGRFCAKVLEGGDFPPVVARAREHFNTVKVKRPKGTRTGSTETYLVALDKKRAKPASPEDEATDET
jgi:23S rRNA (uridine2552-2'-O)-methyltransferase